MPARHLGGESVQVRRPEGPEAVEPVVDLAQRRTQPRPSRTGWRSGMLPVAGCCRRGRVRWPVRLRRRWRSWWIARTGRSGRTTRTRSCSRWEPTTENGRALHPRAPGRLTFLRLRASARTVPWSWQQPCCYSSVILETPARAISSTLSSGLGDVASPR